MGKYEMRFNEIVPSQETLRLDYDMIRSEAARAFGSGVNWSSNSLTDEALQAAFETLKYLWGPGAKSIHRIVAMSNETLASLRPNDRLSPESSHYPNSSWTLDWSQIDLTNLGIDMGWGADVNWDVEDDEYPLFLFTTKIRFDLIDLPATLVHRVELPHENEIVIRKGTPVRIMSVHRMSESPVLHPTERVRSDLTGATFRA